MVRTTVSTEGLGSQAIEGQDFASQMPYGFIAKLAKATRKGLVEALCATITVTIIPPPSISSLHPHHPLVGSNHNATDESVETRP